MTIRAVIFDWGGTLSRYADIELADMWQLAAEHLAPHLPEDEPTLMRRFGQIEARRWTRTTTDQRSGTLADIIAEATAELGVDVGEAILEEAAVRYLDAWTPHIAHDPEAAETLA
ncbi:MAG: HAD family hydrolase, partial [Dehalococcoidia bacterium]|nr:HAD family hydrolase [Dehalococcoidia bacterium]